MAVSTNYIFEKGTCLKSEVYQLIINRLLAAGWKNISSLASTDFVVMQSAGNSGDKNLLLNIRDTNVSNANSIVNTDYCAMSYRLQDTYTPGERLDAVINDVTSSTKQGSTGSVTVESSSKFTGTIKKTYHLKITTEPTSHGNLNSMGFSISVDNGAYSSPVTIDTDSISYIAEIGDGVKLKFEVELDQDFKINEVYDVICTPVIEKAGIFGRPSLAWTNLFITPVAALATALGKDTSVNYQVYTDKSKIILVLEYPSPTTYLPVVLYIGEPDTLFVSDSDSRGVLVACSCQAPAAVSAMICNSSDTVASTTAPYTITLSALLPAGDPNVTDKTMVSSIYYGSATESFRGKLDGVKCCYYSGTNFITGDTVTIGTEIYHVIVTASAGNTSFPSRVLLVRTA